MAAKKKSAPKARIKQVGRIRTTAREKHVGEDTDEDRGEEEHDLGPWIETPQSSRVAAFRYDYLNQAVQVTWKAKKAGDAGRPYIYFGVPYETFRGMVRAVSKGKYIARLGNNYQPMEGEEDYASNGARSAPTSRRR